MDKIVRETMHRVSCVAHSKVEYKVRSNEVQSLLIANRILNRLWAKVLARQAAAAVDEAVAAVTSKGIEKANHFLCGAT